MAERRMFAKTIIDSDAFLDMPLSSQCLYFHLSMRADDEGFINNPKKIVRMIGASEDELKLLIAKHFVIPFESGVCVIKHWRIHNYIRGDRLVATKYQEERSTLTVKENGAYTQISSPEIDDKASNAPETDRQVAYKNSSLPYSFNYKIRRAFEGKICPVCGRKMTSAYTNAKPTVQHNIPVSHGGEHELGNISVICCSCNTSIQDNETGSLNADEVAATWDRIIQCEKNGENWFDNLDLLNVRQVSDKCQSSDSQTPGNCPDEVRLGKDRIVKDRLGEDIYAPAREASPSDAQVCMDLWNGLQVYGIKQVIDITGNRYQSLMDVLQVYGMNKYRRAIELISKSQFLQGHNDKSWVVTFDWFLKNFARVLEGQFDDKSKLSSGEGEDEIAAAIRGFLER